MIKITITIRSSYPKVGPVSARSNPVKAGQTWSNRFDTGSTKNMTILSEMLMLSSFLLDERFRRRDAIGGGQSVCAMLAPLFSTAARQIDATRTTALPKKSGM
jgi:hypothetical protein